MDREQNTTAFKGCATLEEQCRQPCEATGQPAPSHNLQTASHPIPMRFCICSSGTPLVSGTMHFTQMSCNTIIPQKKRKT